VTALYPHATWLYRGGLWQRHETIAVRGVD
jgi:hypothetical protein